jgi:hypothetical protein
MHYKGKDFLNLMGKTVFNYFPRVVYTYWNHVCRCVLAKILRPVWENSFGTRLTSCSFWKITAERLCFSIFSYKPLWLEWLVWDLSINKNWTSMTQIIDTLGFLFLILFTYKFTMKTSKKPNHRNISYILWWLTQNSRTFWNAFLFSNLYVV